MTATPKLLIVEAERQVSSLLRIILVRAGYEVWTAGSAEEAIKTWVSCMNFDAVISETLLPGMDGHEFARQVAACCPSSRHIFVCASNTDCEACPHAPRCPRIGKPFDPKELVRAVAEVLKDRPDRLGLLRNHEN